MPNSTPNAKTKTRKKHILLNQLNIYCTLTTQIIASSILIAFTLWLFLRIPEPQLHVTGFTIDEILNSNTANRTLLHFNITLHNPDLYKSLKYDLLFMRINYSDKSRRYGAFVDFNSDGKTVHQRPTETTVLGNHTVNYTQGGVVWISKDDLFKLKTSIDLRFVLQVRVLVFSRVVATRQRMRTASIFFNDEGNAFVDRRRGLKFQ